jgi:hypothetical protein
MLWLLKLPHRENRYDGNLQIRSEGVGAKIEGKTIPQAVVFLPQGEYAGA